MVLIGSIVIICFLYFYLASAGVVSNLAATAAAPLCAHPLRRRLAVLTTITYAQQEQERQTNKS